jgi:hypothetical protein
MKEEFNLSEKRKEDCQDGYYHEKDVKEFIRLLKRNCPSCCIQHQNEFIDKLAGDRLLK